MTTPTRSKFVFRQPKLSYVANVYVLPFRWTVWLSTFFLVVIAAFALYIVVSWELRKNIADDAAVLEKSWKDIFTLSLGAVCQQGSSVVPSGASGRMITIIIFISLMFLYTSYSANIVALLQSSSNSINTLSDLLKSRLEVGVDDTVFNHFYFPVRLWAQLASRIEKIFIMTILECLGTCKTRDLFAKSGTTWAQT